MSLHRGRKANGDLIPWNIAEQYGDREFPKLSGVRIVRIATHPNYQRMGYGKRAIKLLKDYYAAKFTDLSEQPAEQQNGIEEIEEADVDLLKEQIKPRRKIPTLLKRLSERPPEHVDYVGTSYGLTLELLKFWKNLGFVPVYLSQKANDLTGEHSCIMLHTLEKGGEPEKVSGEWLSLYFNDFRRRILKLLSKSFRDFTTNMALSLLDNKWARLEQQALDKQTMDVYFLPHDLQRLDAYARNQIEFRLILDLVTDVGTLYYQGRIQALKIDTIQKAILLAIGVQGKTVDDIGNELNMPGGQILAKFYDLICKTSQYFQTIVEGHIESKMISTAELNRGDDLVPITLSLEDELNQTAAQLSKRQKAELKALKMESLKEFAIKGTDEEWNKVLNGDKTQPKQLISVKSGIKRLDDGVDKLVADDTPNKKKKMKFSKKTKNLSKSII